MKIITIAAGVMVFWAVSAYALDWIGLHDAAFSAGVMAQRRAPAETATIEELYSAALASLYAYRHAEAAALFHRIRAIDASSVEALWGLAECARREYDFDQARLLLEDVFRLKPGFSPAYVTAGYIEYLSGNFEKAAELTAVVIRNGRKRSDLASIVNAYSMHAGARGMLAHFGGPIAKAAHGGAVLRNLKIAERLAPGSAPVNFGFGSYYLLRPAFMGHDPDAAIERFKRALDADPLFPDVYVRLAQAYKMKGSLREYEQSLARALELDPKNILALDVKEGRCRFICP